MSTTQTNAEEVREQVRERYAEIARDGGVSPGGGCCGPQPAQIAERLGYSSEDSAAVPEGANLDLGCGAPLAAAALQPGETVLDLGSGAGFDAFLAARAVGPLGRVIGVDMTDEMLAKARANAQRAGVSNVEFRKGLIEALPIEDAGIDVVISNCVINLVPDKAAVYREVARVLRAGGRMVISDVVLNQPLPPLVAADVAALTGCIAGAALRDQYLATITAAGLDGIEIVSDKGFGAMVLTMVPDALLRKAEAAGIDVQGVAETVRSLTIRARKR
ncbi:MAG TPA: arsenite methyltransferase [Candidatus Acidoferrales bacterium]|nr:arsenite methyltransferase [Candidatus Acidoferrales bacterium]